MNKEERDAQRNKRFKEKVKELKQKHKWTEEHDQRAKDKGLDKLLKED